MRWTVEVSGRNDFASKDPFPAKKLVSPIIAYIISLLHLQFPQLFKLKFMPQKLQIQTYSKPYTSAKFVNGFTLEPDLYV